MDGSVPPAPTAAAIAASGDNLFRRYNRWLRTAVRKQWGSDMAEDIVAETFLRVAPYAAAGQLRNTKALLLQVARNLVLDLKKRDRVSGLSQTVDDSFFTRMGTPAAQDETLTLKKIVMDLPPELREVFVLKNIEGMAYQEIADTLGIPYTTVNHRLRLAYELTAAAMRPRQMGDD
ncbi:RNA polymerase sigma factor [Caulobacter sp. X]|nr:sigma-70 family RNA polymerase sigma factor [Caulobacter sp. X]